MLKRLMLLPLLLCSIDASAQRALQVRQEFMKKTAIEDPFGLRDPFRPPLKKGVGKESQKQRELMRDGVYTNLDPIGDVDIDKMKIVGVMIGRDRRALARVEGRPDIIILREGMKLGKDNAELKAIHPGGIILVEKLVNVYGEEEYLETVLPISR